MRKTEVSDLYQSRFMVFKHSLCQVQHTFPSHVQVPLQLHRP